MNTPPTVINLTPHPKKLGRYVTPENLEITFVDGLPFVVTPTMSAETQAPAQQAKRTRTVHHPASGNHLLPKSVRRGFAFLGALGILGAGAAALTYDMVTTEPDAQFIDFSDPMHAFKDPIDDLSRIGEVVGQISSFMDQ